MTTIKGTAPMRLELTFDGTEEELIKIAEYQSEQGLDSHDLGDAMGFFLTETMMEGGELTCGHPDMPADKLVQCTIEYDLFSWEGV